MHPRQIKSHIMPSTESMPAQRIPAWKKLGLKLKQPGGGGPGTDAASEPANGSSHVGQPGGPAGHKRKIVEAPPSTHGGSPLKKARRDEQNASRNASFSSSKTKKSVTFGDTPSKNDPSGERPFPTTPTPSHTKAKAAIGKSSKQEQVKSKKPKGPTKKQTPPSTDIKPALEYLRQWKTSREDWKFNKNYQSVLIKNLFQPDIFPASDIDNFYEYIRDLKGAVRERLREMAMEVQMHDMDAGKAGFPDDTMDIDDKQEVYDAILADILRRKRQQQNSPKRKFFNESQFVAESEDPDVVIRRVVKRMRAELVLDELSDDGETTDTTSTSMSSKTVTASDNNATVTTNGDKQNVAREGVSRRRRKLRVNMDDSSSSESESESDSDEDDSSSSSESSDSDEEADGRPDNGYDTSSSSSSSSSDDGDTEDEDSDEEDNSTPATAGVSRQT